MRAGESIGEPRIGTGREWPTSLKRGTPPWYRAADFPVVASFVSGPRAVRGLLAALATATGVYVAYAALGLNEYKALAAIFDNWVYYGLLLGAAGACLARGLYADRKRRAWLALGIAVLSWTAGDLYWVLFLRDDATVPFPSLADACYLGFYPPAYIAFFLLLRARVGDVPRSLWLDGLIGGLTVSGIGAALVFQPVLDSTEGSPLAVATNLAYPLGDLLLLGLIVGFLGLTGWRLERAWIMIGAGLAVFAVADSVYLYQAAVGSYVEGTLLDAGWLVAIVLIALGAWQPTAERRQVELEGYQLVAIPSIFAVLGLGLLVYDHFEQQNVLALTLAAAAVLAVIVRMCVTFHERMKLLARAREESLTDSLTGLGNRRRFMLELQGRLRDGARSERFMLALFDLDGFKSYNDSFGHLAGDALLKRLATKLDAASSSWGRAYRMGGDEFCILSGTAPTNADRQVATAGQALSEQGEGFVVTSAYGAALLPDEANTPSDALRLADARMYADKESRRPSLPGETSGVLLRAQTERDRALGEHASDVADLAEPVARRLGFAEEDLQRVRQVAELHDVGKLAIPDAILEKPGTLTEDEWELVKRHPVVGQRILASAPALVHIAELVRATHERFDGDGYPDGLAGTDIPLVARIVAVCDAFHAMTSGRPYRPAVTPEEALAELRRCAGTQFDPAVVAAFLAELGARPAELVA
jgi:two-component system, cell cycle response regulator